MSGLVLLDQHRERLNHFLLFFRTFSAKILKLALKSLV